MSESFIKRFLFIGFGLLAIVFMVLGSLEPTLKEGIDYLSVGLLLYIVAMLQ